MKNSMKAVVYHHYGSPEMLHVEEIQKPVPGRDEVLVKVHAVSVNDWDLGLLRGKPLVNRLLFGLFKPRRKILGSDIAGTIEMVGSNVKQWKVGDEVFGDLSGRWGGFAEYAVAPAAALMLKPPGMNFEQAAAVPQAALLALQGLRNKMTVQKGHHVLINGGGGGAGTFAIQMAKSVGATVTAVDSASKLETMLSVGADHVIDYKSEDFTKNGQQYDLILDLAAYHSIFDYKKSLTPNGRYI
ncbi:MAG TPA: NAD(P)-dependent alcohol dehydrogenase, partial [Chitinophagaceae bacterium]